MEQRPAPEITIEGGSGWQLGTPREALGTSDDVPARAPGRRRRVGGLVLAAALGFAAATAVAEARTTTLADSDDGVLSLEVRADEAGGSGDLVTDGDGQVSLATSIVVRNTGPRPVGLEQAELVGTPYRSDALAGKRVADGGQAVVALLRPVDCTDLGRTPPPGPLRITATTGTGLRTVDLRMDAGVLGFHDEIVRGACGRNDVSSSLVADEKLQAVVDGRLRLTVGLSNASGRPLLVTGLQPLPGLRLVEVLTEALVPAPLPLGLPPGDYDPPVDPYQGRGPEQTVVLLLEIEDCTQVPVLGADEDAPAVQVQVSDLDGRPGQFAVGGDQRGLRQYQDAVCGARVSPAGADPGPSLAEISEQALHALRRDHPFLTPD